MAKNINQNLRIAIITGGFVIVAAVITGLFGLWQGGCNKQEPTLQIKKGDESIEIITQEINGDNMAGDKIQNFYFGDSSKEEEKKDKGNNSSTASVPRSNEKPEVAVEEAELEISIQLPYKSGGFESVFVDGKEALVTASSTPRNPRILIKSNKERNQLITIVTKNRDTCTLKRIFDSSQKDNFPILVPDCF